MIRSVFNSFKNTKSISHRTATTSSNLPLKVDVDVVIIGGGVTGCSILYQLAKRGIRASLIERGKLTCGTTFHTAGLVWSLRPNKVEIEILKGTKRVFKELGAEKCGWINNGSLLIAHSSDQVNEFVQMSELGKTLGVNSHILGRKEASELFPLLDSSKFEAALYSLGIFVTFLTKTFEINFLSMNCQMMVLSIHTYSAMPSSKHRNV